MKKQAILRQKVLHMLDSKKFLSFNLVFTYNELNFLKK